MRRVAVAIARMLGIVLLSFAIAYVLFLAGMWRYQEALIFPAPGGIDATSLDQSASEVGAEPLHLTAEDGVALYGWIRRPNPDKDAHCAVLYFHGNGETVAGTVPLGRFVARRGCAFLQVAYRGYPGSGGHPSEEGIAKDARALWAEALARGFTPDRIMLHGLSLGGGVAIRLASEVKPAALAINSSFTSLVDVAAREYPWLPVHTLLRPRFESLQRAPGITAPTLVVHGDADGLIPVEQGRTLAAAFPHAKYVEVTGGPHTQLVLEDEAARGAYNALLDWLIGTDRTGLPAGW